MKFQCFPIIDIMIDFYHRPKGIDRFWDYLKILKGNSKEDMEVPIPYFNPMGKEHVLVKLQQLKSLHVEALMREVLDDINTRVTTTQFPNIRVALSLADDLKGGWTNRYTTDYDSKFKVNGYINRDFCIPIFWTNEIYDIAMIKRRIEEYCFRTLYWKMVKQPESLEEHLDQELFVVQRCTMPSDRLELVDYTSTNDYFENYRTVTDHSRIFNFLYGDEYCSEIGYATYGIKERMAEFAFAQLKNKLLKKTLT